MPKNYSLKKIMAVVSALCSLHNFLIDAGEAETPRSHSEEDEWSLAVSGAVPMGARGGMRGLPLQLLDAGHHRQDDPLRANRGPRTNRDRLPRDELFQQVLDKRVHHPQHRQRRR